MIAVTAAVPLYRPDPNHVAELVERLRSCRTVAEIVFTDDDPAQGVVSGLRELIDCWAGAAGVPLRYYANEHRLGMVGNWNAAVERAAGELVVVHCQDDLVRPSHFDALVERLVATPGTDIAIGAYTDVVAGRELGRPSRFGNGDEALHEESYAELVAVALSHGNVYGFPSSTVFRRQAWQAVGGYNNRYEHAADLEFVLRIARRSGGALVQPEPVADRRIHDSNLTHSHVASGATARDRRRLVDDFGVDLRNATDRRRMHANLAARAVHDSVRHVAAGRWRQVVEVAPVVARHGALGLPSLGWAVAAGAAGRSKPMTTTLDRAPVHRQRIGRVAQQEGGIHMAETAADRSTVEPLLDYLRSIDSRSPLSELYTDVARQICSIVQPTSLLEVGAGRNPLLLGIAEELGVAYSMNDISASELSRAPDGYEKLCFDIGGELAIDRTFDLVMSRLVFEHVRHGGTALRNSARLLAPDGIAIHFAPTLYALPFVANKFLPDGLASKALRLFNPRDEEAAPKFRAHYDHCRTTRRAVERAAEIVAPCDFHVVPYYEHEYYRRLPVVRSVADRVHHFARTRDLRPLSTYAFFVIHRDGSR